MIQAGIRALQARELTKKIRGAIALQSLWKMHKARVAYNNLRLAVIQVQALHRCRVQRNIYLNMIEAAKSIQVNYN